MKSQSELREEWIEKHTPDITHDASRSEVWWVVVMVDESIFPPCLTFRGSSFPEAVDRAMKEVE